MNKQILPYLLFGGIFFLFSAIGQSQPPKGTLPAYRENTTEWLPELPTTTVMTFNIRNTMNDKDEINITEAAKAFQRIGADYIALQEIDSVTERCHGRDILKELAIECGMYPTYAAAIDYQGGKYGIGILSKKRPISSYNVSLPGKEEKRTLLVADFEDFVLANTHLSLNEADRLASLPIILQEATRHSKPFLLVGDWNDTLSSVFMNELEKHFLILNDKSKKTFPSRQPKKCLDYLAVFRPTGEAILQKSAKVASQLPISDHRASWIDFWMKTPKQKILYGTPYLQSPQNDGITIQFQTQTMANAWIEYGLDTMHTKRIRMEQFGQTICHSKEYKIRLQHLQPGKTYYYRVCAQELLSYGPYHKVWGDSTCTPYYSFQLPTSSKKDFTALVFNDLHQYASTIDAFGKIADSIQYDFVIFNGDCLTEPNNRQEAISMIHRLTEVFNTAQKPAFFIRGNHEIRGAYSAELSSLIDLPGGRPYGAFSWGDTRFVFLDCGEDKPDSHWAYAQLNDFSQFREDQCSFLKTELKSKVFKKAERKILIHHIPIWGNTDEYQPCTQLWSPLLQKANFDIDLTGHTHQYRYLKTGSEGNPFPVIIGSGPHKDKAVMLVITKKGEYFSIRVLNSKGDEVGIFPIP